MKCERFDCWQEKIVAKFVSFASSCFVKKLKKIQFCKVSI